MPTITADLTEGYCVEVGNGRHTWFADEPVDLGGTDEGPTPYEMLLGSVAACTGITLSMYAKRKGIELHSVSVRYTYEKLHADDCGFCESEAEGFIDTVTSEVFVEGFIDTVTSEVFVEGDFTEEQRQRLAEVAVRCPVHKTLERGITFNETIYVG